MLIILRPPKISQGQLISMELNADQLNYPFHGSAILCQQIDLLPAAALLVSEGG